VRTLRAELPELPVVCLSREDLSAQATAVGARACVRHVEREALLAALTDAGLFTSPEVTAEAA
jgi:hypothetical protein